MCALALALAGVAFARTATAQVCTGVDYFEACLDAIGGRPMGATTPRDSTRIIDDIFTTADTPPRFAPQLTFGQLVPERSAMNSNGCGTGRHVDRTSYTAYQCEEGMRPVERYREVCNGLDWLFAQNYRMRADGTGAPDQDNCGGNNATCGYESPWLSSMVFDLQGAANRVVVFPMTDHVTDSCLEAFEYSVYLTDNPASREIVPAGGTADPTKWNRALLVRAFLRGWTDDPDSTGTVMDMGVHELRQATRRGTPTEAVADSISTVWALPCGVNFRYVGIVPGNYGNPDARCAFHSAEDEFDAVAGLNEDGTAICPDADGDGFRAASCGGNDCNDNDRAINPGAVEDCRTAGDVNCDGERSTCPTGTACIGGVCASGCLEGSCADGFACTRFSDPSGEYCLPNVCRDVTCAPGEICGPSGCQAPCDGARCPSGQACLGGACADVCAGVTCPRNQHCDGGRCVPNCGCTGCPDGQTCSETSGRCERPACAALECAPELRDCTGATPRCRASFCDGVICPAGQTCDAEMRSCVPDRCFGVLCPLGQVCTRGTCGFAPRDAGPPDVIALDAPAPFDAGGLDATLDVRPMTDTGGSDTRRPDAGTTDTSPSCGCRTPGGAPASSRAGLALGALAVAGVVARRARRRQSALR